MPIAGAFLLVASSFWIAGTIMEDNYLSSMLGKLGGFSTSSNPYSFGAAYGAYTTIFAGLFLVFGYILSRKDALERPLD